MSAVVCNCSCMQLKLINLNSNILIFLNSVYSMSSQVVVKSDFEITDEEDALQIANADTELKQALVYMVKDKKCISYMGIKWLVLKMSQKDQALEIIGMPSIELVKYDEEDKKTWVWQSMIKVRNKKTGLESIGASENPYADPYRGHMYDPFGRTKAISKAERNAFRKQIPELELTLMIKDIDAKDVKTLKSESNGTTKINPVDPKLLELLKKLGYTGITPKSTIEAGQLIYKLKEAAIESEKK